MESSHDFAKTPNTVPFVTLLLLLLGELIFLLLNLAWIISGGNYIWKPLLCPISVCFSSRPWHTRGRGDASADDSLRREVGSQSLNTVDEDDADARHLLGPLLDDLGDGGPSTNRRG